MKNLYKGLAILALAAAGTFAYMTNEKSDNSALNEATVTETAPPAAKQVMVASEDVLDAQTAQELDAAIRNSTLPVAVMFYAEWCDFCKDMHPMFAAAAKDMKGQVLFITVDVDKVQAQLQSLPTTFLISADKKILGPITGAAPSKEAIEELLKKAFGL